MGWRVDNVLRNRVRNHYFYIGRDGEWYLSRPAHLRNYPCKELLRNDPDGFDRLIDYVLDECGPQDRKEVDKIYSELKQSIKRH
jgi:hypothetical protein